MPDAPHRRSRPLTPRLTVDDLAGLAAAVPLAGERPLDPVRAPWSGDVVGVVPRCAEADVEAAVRAARAAQAAWAAEPARARVAVLHRYADLVLAARDLLLDVVQLESGKARLHAFDEVMDVAVVARYYARTAVRALAPAARRGVVPILTRVRERRVPYGVVGMIAPWNYPLSMAVTDALPALAAGNAVVLKPAEQTPFTALLAAFLLRRAGLPADLFTVLPGPGPALGPALLDRVDAVAFTGSTEVGRRVGAHAGGRLVPVSLELGGKNALVVLEDADLDRAVDGTARGAFTSAGQLCISTERVFVARPLFDAFVGRLAARTRSLRVGPGFGYDVDMGSLVSSEVLEKVEAHVEEARGAGASILTGGRRLSELGPLFYAPTLVTGVRAGMRMAHEETFGPVVALHAVDGDDEAVARANDTPYGLNASVWTRDVRRGERVAARLRAGTVNVNEAFGAAWASVDAPMGGMKASGVGRRHGREGLLKYTEAQTVATQRGLALGVPPGLAPETFVRLATAGLRVLNRFGGGG